MHRRTCTRTSSLTCDCSLLRGWSVFVRLDDQSWQTKVSTELVSGVCVCGDSAKQSRAHAKGNRSVFIRLGMPVLV